MKTSRRSCLVALFALIASAASENCSTLLDDRLLVAEKGTIWLFNPEDKSREAYVSSKSPIRMAYSSTRNTLYYSDMITQQVFALKDNSAEPRVVVANRGTKWLPWSLAVDDVNDKLYVIESFASVLLVYDLASGDNSVVIGTNITYPKDVELDADEGYLFVLDRYQILRAELDGSKSTPIYRQFKTDDELSDELTDAVIGSVQPPSDRTRVRQNPISIADLTLDVKSKRIYWVDTWKRTVESSDYDGENHKVHFRDTSVPGVFESLASVAYLNGVIYWADDVTRKVFKIYADKSYQVVSEGIETHAIAAISCEQRPTTENPCANNQCQQLCLLSKSSQTGYSCACKVEFELAPDGRSCHSVQDFILFTQEYFLRGKSLSESHKDVIVPYRFPIGKLSVIDFDANSSIVYYSADYPEDQLHEINLQNGSTKILDPGFLSNSIGDIAYDWTTKNLYFLSYYYTDATSLCVANLNDPTYSKILIKNVPRLVRGLAVHPNKGYVFFARLDDESSQQSRGSISRLATDGTELKLILDLGHVDDLDALTVDYDGDRIYWTETTMSGDKKIRHANLDGQDIREVGLPKSFKGAISLAIYDNYIYGVSKYMRLLYRMDKDGKNIESLVHVQKPEWLSDVKVFSRSLQVTRPDHPCKSNNCQKFCFAVPTGSSDLKGVCGCPYGQKLAKDGVSCVHNLK